MTKNNNVKVKVKFSSEKDENLDLINLTARVTYSIPTEIGFVKPKYFEVTLIEDTQLILWMKEVKSLMVGTRIKRTIQKEVEKHIMKRLDNNYNNQDVVANILNMFNQMKFDFNFDFDSGQKIIEVGQTVAFGTKPNDYFNLHNN